MKCCGSISQWCEKKKKKKTLFFMLIALRETGQIEGQHGLVAMLCDTRHIGKFSRSDWRASQGRRIDQPQDSVARAERRRRQIMAVYANLKKKTKKKKKNSIIYSQFRSTHAGREQQRRGHCVVAVGLDDEKRQKAIFRSLWR
jgi:hypothetical protein